MITPTTGALVMRILCGNPGKKPCMDEFLLGVNYWPRRSAMYMWERFDLGEIREDFARIRSLQLPIVRFFIAWDDFEPSPGMMDERMLRRFDLLMDAAANAGIKTMPTFFTGHMSGVNYVPAWSLDPGRPHGRFRTFGKGMRQLPFGVGDFYAGPVFNHECLTELLADLVEDEPRNDVVGAARGERADDQHRTGRPRLLRGGRAGETDRRHNGD